METDKRFERVKVIVTVVLLGGIVGFLSAMAAQVACWIIERAAS
jgi:hypothetical protein